MSWLSNKGASRPGEQPIENVLGRSAVVRGDLKGEGGFRIDGSVEGSVESRATVVIGESGSVHGDVRGSDIVIAGTVQGNVVCSGHLEIVATGKVEGDIEARSVRIETGGIFRGTSRMGSEVVKEEKSGRLTALP